MRKSLSLALAVLATAAAPAAAQTDAERAVVWAVGDGADGSGVARAMAARIARARPDRFLYLGDVYPSGTAAQFQRNYAPVYGRMARITEPTIGNHEWANRRTGYYPWWRAAKGRSQRPWYAFRVAGWELVNLNSEAPHGPTSDQLRWLRRRLRAPGTCRLAYWHRPRYSAGSVHGDASDIASLWNSLRGHARLVVNGHEHNMQRFRRRDGLTQYVSGAGGQVLYRLQRDRRLAWSAAGVRGALRIVLEPGKATLEFRSATGRLLDRSRATCRP